MAALELNAATVGKNLKIFLMIWVNALMVTPLTELIQQRDMSQAIADGPLNLKTMLTDEDGQEHRNTKVSISDHQDDMPLSCVLMGKRSPLGLLITQKMPQKHLMLDQKNALVNLQE